MPIIFMSQKLPVSEFRWLKDPGPNDILKQPDDSDTGYILEVDLDYPNELHDLHNDYPLAPETLEVENSWLSEHQKKWSIKNICPKLVNSLRNKKNYVVHYRNLKFYLDQGMKLTKVHRVLAFKQSAWMEPYIRKNTELRKQAKTDFEKDFFKLLNNSVFGKTMENLRKRTDVRLVRSSEPDKLRKLIAKPNFSRTKLFDDSLAALHMYKTRLTLNKPVYVGMSVLDLSKLWMYDFWYSNLKKKYGLNIQLMYSDTDSILAEVRTEDIYSDIAADIANYDTSNYPKDHPLYSTTNNKVLGKFKDECAGAPIVEFVGLRPKMYSVLIAREKDSNIRKAKGVKKYIVKKQICHTQYIEALKGKVFHHQMNSIRSYNHRIHQIRMNKTSLSPQDTKRYILDDGITTFAFGNKNI